MRHTALPDNIVAQPGTYALILQATSAMDLQIGRHGRFQLQSGFYVYCGSAFGSGGVRARLAHHSRVALRPHWHIDYLRRATDLRQIWYSYDDQRREHQWAEIFRNLPDATQPFPRFGASDCRCPSHLLYFSTCPAFAAFYQRLYTIRAGHAAILRCSLAPGDRDSPVPC